MENPVYPPISLFRLLYGYVVVSFRLLRPEMVEDDHLYTFTWGVWGYYLGFAMRADFIGGECDCYV